MRVDKRILTVEELENMFLGKLWGMDRNIRNARKKLNTTLNLAVDSEQLDIASLASEQIYFIDKNLKLIGVVLMSKESDVFTQNDSGFELCVN